MFKEVKENKDKTDNKLEEETFKKEKSRDQKLKTMIIIL